jgi:hemerythrin-like domain-containing protein
MTAPEPRGPRRVGRRAVLLGGGRLAAGVAGAGTAAWALTRPSAAAPDPSGVIPPDDDLMREHGVLKRVLLCYREMISRVQAGGRLPAQDLRDAALIIHDYIEGFHEGLEEGYVFPRLRAAGQLTDTVTTLLMQHARGRVITQFLLARATPAGVASTAARTELAAAMQAFDRMYEPHEAREDTVVFPVFRQIVPAAELADLGQHFAELERQQFGTDEFTAMVARVAGIEQALGIYDLSQFTPEVSRYAPN